MKHILSFTILLLISLCAFSCNKEPDNQKDTTKIFYKWDSFVMGADLSYINEIQDYNGVYRDSGNISDPFRIFKDHGANVIRVRLWNNPAWMAELTGGKIYSNLTDVEKTIRRAKNEGMAVCLDLHYSDTWADPQKQGIPAAWQGLGLEKLSDSLYSFTFNTLEYLKSKNLTPEIIQIGNEINTGLLWPVGEVTNENWQNVAVLLKSGIKAVRDFSQHSDIKPKIMLHVAQFQNVTWWTDGIINKGGVTDFDIIGISHYAKWSTVSSFLKIDQFIRTIRSKYSKQVMIAEVAYPWTNNNADSYNNIISGADTVAGFPATPEGQYEYMKELTRVVYSAGGSGIFYWEPAWITSNLPDQWGTGSAWDNCTFFDFQGNTLPAINYMTVDYKSK